MKACKSAGALVSQSLPLLPLCHANEVVGGTDVEGSEELDTGQAHESFLDEGQWIPVLNGPFVEASVIDAQAEGSIGLLDEQNRGCS